MNTISKNYERKDNFKLISYALKGHADSRPAGDEKEVSCNSKENLDNGCDNSTLCRPAYGFDGLDDCFDVGEEGWVVSCKYEEYGDR
jgi:hypothetical protein